MDPSGAAPWPLGLWLCMPLFAWGHAETQGGAVQAALDDMLRAYLADPWWCCKCRGEGEGEGERVTGRYSVWRWVRVEACEGQH